MMDQLNHLIDVEKFESSNGRCTLQSLYTALDHQLQDGLIAQYEFDRMRYVVRKLFDLKLQIHAIEAEPSLPLPADEKNDDLSLSLGTEVNGHARGNIYFG